jgi:superfamily II DNA or RNA helicase
MRLSDGPRRHILYSSTVKDAETMADLVVSEFERSGMKASLRVLVGTTSNIERNDILQWVAEGDRKEVRIISSVHVLDEGIDIPAVDCVYICGTGGSECRYVQRVCRSVRSYPDKKQATVLVWSMPEDMKDLSDVFPRTAWLGIINNVHDTIFGKRQL